MHRYLPLPKFLPEKLSLPKDTLYRRDVDYLEENWNGILHCFMFATGFCVVLLAGYRAQ